jgi:hypothetical protein
MADEPNGESDWLALVDWQSLAPQHQPRALVNPREPPPTQPNPLVNGRVETLVATSAETVSRIESKLIGTNTNALVTKPPAAPSTSETLVVALDPGVPTATRKVNSMVSVPGAGVAAFAILACPASGTKITAIALSIRDPATAPVAASVEVLIDVAGAPTNVLFRGAVHTDSAITLALDGPVFSTANLQLSVPARAGTPPTVNLYYNVYGRDVAA